MDCRVREVEPLLHEMNPQYRLNRIWLATHLAFARIVFGNLARQVILRYRALYLAQELVAARLLALARKFRSRKTQLVLIGYTLVRKT